MTITANKWHAVTAAPMTRDAEVSRALSPPSVQVSTVNITTKDVSNSTPKPTRGATDFMWDTPNKP